jgi:hypothetical protein
MDAEEKNREIKNIQNPHYVSVYANNVAMALNFFDLSMIFGEMVEATEEILVVDQKVRVTMPPSHAKLLLLLLMQQLQQYEEKFGQIVIPPEVLQPSQRRILDETVHEG